MTSDSNTPTGNGVAAREIVFVDSRVKDVETLLKGFPPDAQVFYLQAGEDGLAQMAEVLGQEGDVGAVHVLAHGSEGQLWLGNTFLDSGTLAGHSDVLAAIGRGLTADGDLLVYACNLAQGEAGTQFVASLAALTGADVAASNNRTGADGDWELEISTGVIDNAFVLSDQALGDYAWGLGTWTVTNNLDSGVGSLRAAIGSAQNGDNVSFSTSMTVALTQNLVVSKNITIDGDLNNDDVADVTLDGQYRTQILSVDEGATATLDGLVITRGMAAGNGGNGGSDALMSKGGGIYNAGTLTINNTTVTANAASGGGGGGGVTPQYAGGGGGGGAGIGGQDGGQGGTSGAGLYAGTAGSPNQGGNGGGYDADYMGGRGGSSTGGAGGVGTKSYSNGGAGGTANNGSISIGGGGGGSGWDKVGGAGGSASGGIYNASTGSITVIGTSVISNNIGAGGGGGGGGGGGLGVDGGSNDPGGAGGRGVGAIWNEGTLLITAANFAAMTGNAGGSGSGGPALGGGAAGTSPTSVGNIFNNGGFLNTAYVQDLTPPTASVVVANTTLNSGGVSLVTITFSEAVTGLAAADLTVENGTLTEPTTNDAGITWTATLTAASNIADTTNVITLNNAGVADLAGNAGVGTTTSNNYVVNDTVAPTASILVADTALRIGDTSTVTITFSEAVTGFSNADLNIANGALTAVSSPDGGITWTATLTPTDGIADATNLITLDSTGVTDHAGNAGAGTTDSNSYAIDTQRPTAAVVVADTALRIGETSTVTFTFSEAVSGFTTADLSIANGTVTGLGTGDGGRTWTATFTPNADVTATTNLITLDSTGVTDHAGNAGSGSTNSNNYAIDTQRPTATIAVADTSLSAGETSLVTITFSEAVTGFTTADLIAGNGTVTGLSSSDGGITWTATLTPTDGVADATNLITLANTGVADPAGNTGTGTTNSNNYAIDTQRPTATIVVADTALSIGETSAVTITFSEAVNGFSNADLNIANGVLTEVSSQDGGITWTAMFTPSAEVTDTTNLITLDNTGVANLAGNAGAGTTDSNNYSIDTERPTATVVMGDTALAVGETSVVTVAFSEAVTGFTLADMAVDTGSLSGLSTSDNITYTATFTPGAGITDATNQITLDNTGVTDQGGNAGTGTTDSNNFVIDTVRPTATIVLADTFLSAGETSLVTITFSEAVTGFSNADLSIANGALTDVSSSDGGITWTATLTPNDGVADATNLITLANTGVADPAGNTGTGTTNSNNYAIDTQRPTATIVVADTAVSIGETSAVTITFSEAVTGFTTADLTVANGTVTGLSSGDGGITWTATLTPSADVTDTTNLITLDNTGVTDQTGNAGSGTTDSNSYAIDTQRPTATMVVADTSLSAGETSLVTITFSEAVTGFTTDDLTVANGTVTGLSSGDGGITWTATLTPSAGVTDTTNLITLDNTGVTDQAGNAGTGTTDSNNYLVDGIAPTLDTASVNGSQLVLSFTEDTTLDAANPPVPGDFAVLVGAAANAVTAVAVNAAAKTVTLTLTTAVLAGQAVTVAYTDPGAGNDANAIQDAAGNDAESFAATTATNLTPALPPVTPPVTPPVIPPPVVDGVPVITTPGDGGTTVITIPVVLPTRPDDPATTNAELADISLVTAPGGRPILQVSLPAGVGLQAQGLPNSVSGNAALAELDLRIERLAGGNPELTNSGSVFYASMDPGEALVVQTITATAGVGFNPAIPFVISGSANAADGKQAVILDVRALPSGAIVQVDNVDFIAVVGAVRVIGGAGQNMASGDNENQWIVLGADDDILHGGGGKDTVGSLGGNDQVYGDAGNDIVFGGTGHDLLSGGSGNDRLDGGLGWDTALQAGRLADYTLAADGQVLVFTHRTTGEVDRLKSIEQVKFDSGPALYIADSEAEAAVAHIATRWLDRAPTALEGAWAQENSGLTALQVAEVVLQAAGGLFPGRTAQELVAGLQDNAQIVRMDVIPELNQGTAGLDELRIELNRADVHLQRTGTDRWEATSLIDGNMAESVGIERLHLKDISVALDMQGTAGQVAGLLAVTFGAPALAHQGLAGAGLAALDAGMSLQALSGFAIDALQQQQGHAFAAQELVQLLWTNAIGSAGTQQQLQPFVQQLQSGEIGAQELVSAAAQYALAHPSAELVGVLDFGLFYSAQA